MKINSAIKKFGYASFMLGLTSLLVFSAPMQVKAEYNPGEGGNELLCKKLEGLTEKLTGKLEEKNKKLKSSRSDQNSRFDKKRGQAEQQLAIHRAEVDKKQHGQFLQLKKEATDPAQKAAVEAYILALREAIDDRRSAYDAANKQFQNSVESAVSKRKALLDGQVATLKNEISTAVSTATASCPEQGAAAIEKMKSDIKTARQNYKAARKTDGTIKNQLKQFQATRKAATEQASKDYLAAVSSAKEAFHKAMVSSGDTSP